MEYVYIIKPRHSNVYKIGQTTDLERRLKTLRRKFNFELELVYSVMVENSYQIEQMVHAQAYKSHLGGDWFALEQETLSAIIEDLKVAR
jgi:hypothetical protein